MPLMAALAVALCSAMVLITWSVMGGFLKMMLEAGRMQIGDVVISWPSRGFAHYDELVRRLEADQDHPTDPLIVAASPMIETAAMITLPGGAIKPIRLRGVDPESYQRVTRYAQTLHWRPIEQPTRYDRFGEDYRLQPSTTYPLPVPSPAADETNAQQVARVLRLRNDEILRILDRHGLSWGLIYDNGLSMTRRNDDTGERRPAIVLGIELSRQNERKRSFYFSRRPFVLNEHGNATLQDVFLPANGTVSVTFFPTSEKGTLVDSVTRVLPVANEFKTGIYEIDDNTALTRLDVVQAVLYMNEARRTVGGGIGVRPDGTPYVLPSTEIVDPARVTSVLVLGVSADRLADIYERCRAIYADFAADHPDVPRPEVMMIQTWEDLNRTFIDAVRNEMGLVLIVFTFISLTAVFLVWAIFWSMVSEKTKDIGILRALGASRRGIAGLWLSYAAAIGLTGICVGLLLAHVIVWNINAIQDTLGRTFNIQIWNPEVYYFIDIPSSVDPRSAVFVAAGGILACLLGALVPAIRASRMDPVRALRFE